MRRECRERFPCHRLRRKPLISDPGMHHGTCVTHVPWCMPGSLTRGGEENVPGIPGACAVRKFTYLARGPWHWFSSPWFIPALTLNVRNTVYPKKYAHGFVVLCFVVVMQSFIMNSYEVFIYIHQGCFAGTGVIVRLPQCQWSKPDGYGKISQCITTTKHSKAVTVCIFLGIYCNFYKWLQVITKDTIVRLTPLVPHICVNEPRQWMRQWSSVGSGNGLLLTRRQTITWTNAGLL